MDKKMCGNDGRRLNVSGVLGYLGVSRSGYNSWKNRVPSIREQRKNNVKNKICDIYDEPHQNYGAPKITAILNKNGETISEKTVGNYMREMGLKAQWIKPYTITTIAPNFSEKYKNILKKQFNPDTPDAVWCPDITYIWTFDGFVCLTSIMDLYSRKIIAWELSRTLEAKWIINAVEKAKKNRHVTRPLIMHPDRGCQYTSADYIDATEGMTRSYSKKGYPWDNACIESFHSLLKREWISRFKIKDYKDAYKLVIEYIETFYNTVRIHSHCNYESPNKHEKNYWKELRKLEIEVA